jgi:hypothetical protein
MRGQPERVAECTSINFDGMIAMLKPDESWVAKWQRISMSLFLSRVKYMEGVLMGRQKGFGTICGASDGSTTYGCYRGDRGQGRDV